MISHGMLHFGISLWYWSNHMQALYVYEINRLILYSDTDFATGFVFVAAILRYYGKTWDKYAAM